MSHASEKDLRIWLRNVWNKGEKDLGLQWIEPAAGSSVGFPDVLIPVWPSLVPVELKISQLTNKHFLAHVRPVQRRFHLLMQKQNFFSCFLLITGEKDCFDVWLSHNSFHPWIENDSPGELLIASNQKTESSVSRVHLVHEILSLMNKHNQVMLQIPGKH